jgi:predicted RNA-binding protein associated with RNAse of E/G family
VNTTKTKRVKCVTTVQDLLARDDVNDVLREMNKLKPNISDMIVIYMNREDEDYYFEITEGTPTERLVWMLEKTKLDILNSKYEVEE